jgi:hypothetical protein
MPEHSTGDIRARLTKGIRSTPPPRPYLESGLTLAGRDDNAAHSIAQQLNVDTPSCEVTPGMLASFSRSCFAVMFPVFIFSPSFPSE